MATLGQYADEAPNMTKQQVFDVCCEHMITQGKRSFTEGLGCCYKHPEGICCPAALFVKGYTPRMEQNNWEDLVMSFGQTPVNKRLIYSIQMVHDNMTIEFWPTHLGQVANEFDLKIPTILQEKLQ